MAKLTEEQIKIIDYLDSYNDKESEKHRSEQNPFISYWTATNTVLTSFTTAPRIKEIAHTLEEVKAFIEKVNKLNLS